MAEDWLADVKKYVPNADPAVVAAIVRYCGIALQKRNSSLVSMSDPKETGRVRENFLKKKLALTDPDETLDAAIASVGERMKADRTKNRVTVYYLLAEHFGKLGLFGGGATATATGGASASGTSDAAGAATLGAAGLAAGAAAAAVGGVGGENTPPPAAAAPPPPPEPAAPAPAESGIGALGATGAAAVGSAVAGATAAASGAGSAVSGAANEAASRFADTADDGGSGSGMGKWLLWLLLALVLVALFFGLRSCMNQQATVVSNASDTTVAGDMSGTVDNGTADNGAAAIDTNEVTAPPAAAPGATAAPVGAGVVAGTRDGLPMLTVYFDTGKAEVAKDFATVAGSLKDYVAAHPDAKLAVSGFNDPTGNAAVNAALSKRRAQGVAAAIEATGVPAAAVALEKPADTTVTGTSNAEARRVEVTVKQ